MKTSQNNFPSNFLGTFTLTLENTRPKQIRLTKERKFRVGGETVSAGECSVQSADDSLTFLPFLLKKH